MFTVSNLFLIEKRFAMNIFERTALMSKNVRKITRIAIVSMVSNLDTKATILWDVFLRILLQLHRRPKMLQRLH